MDRQSRAKGSPSEPVPESRTGQDRADGVIVSDLTLHGMHCESCARIIERTVSRHAGARVTSVDMANNRLIIESRRGHLEEIRDELRGKGYQLLLPGERAAEGFEAGSFRRGIDVLKKVIFNARGFEVEHTLFRYALGAIALVLVVQAVLFGVLFKNTPGYLNTYWSVMLLTTVSVVAFLFAYYHSNAFRKSSSCMTGMMTGMTFGMAGGFLIGAFVGATNGMFLGSIIGMGAGMSLGYVTGRSCGVMGVMEGMMGGLMAGTMGAMLSAMLIYDRLVPFLFILVGTEGVILVAFSYMLYKEFGNMTKQDLRVSGMEFAVLALALNLALTVVYVFGPKTGYVLGG
ncbi:cation transporter [Methanosphaerula palustris]|uniref:cation transporter n=1 Tax=Methanosphaerula palustris TaxID=475088 RepID=UPI0011D0A77E|nr:cation transporter [Methanosphaerula palustris]